MKNYRHVSNLPNVSKLLERVVAGQLHEQLEQKHHSCETALVEICGDILSSMDSNKCVLLILLDQSAAFDTVHQDLLINRLTARYGITGKALQ